MGGAAGHLNHPYELYKDPKDFLNFFKCFLTGEIEGTEKIDGYNLFIGFNENGKVVAVRNKNYSPIENIAEKFPLTHGAYAGFTAGWKAIKSKLENLSNIDRKKYNLVGKDEQPKNFLNIEILFGYIPNVVPYSETTNYIIFHAYTGTPRNDWKPQDIENENNKLRRLANKLNSVAINSSEIIFLEESDDIQKIRKDIKSYWKFKGPIDITKKDIKLQLIDIANKWKSYPEVIKLKKEKDLDIQLQLMKTITKKIGSEVLKAMVSKLSDTGKNVKGHPGIEGIVLKQNGDKVKITGTFLDFSKPPDVQIFDATKDIREFIQKKVFGLTTSTLRSLKNKTLAGLYEYAIIKRKKSYKYDINEQLDIATKEDIITITVKAQQKIKKLLPELRKKVRTYDLRNILSQSFMLQKLKENIQKVITMKDLLVIYGRIFYNINKKS